MMASLWMNVWILSLRFLQVLRGGKNRVEMRVSTDGGCRPHPGQGRIRAREEREREVRGRRGLAPRRRAHQVALGQVAQVRASAATATAQW